MEEIGDDKYHVVYDAETATVSCQGIMWLSDEAYKPIMQLLNKVIAAELPQMTVDLRELKKLNSSGTSVLSQFIINAKKRGKSQLVFLCNKQITWQKKSVYRFSGIMPTLQIEWE